MKAQSITTVNVKQQEKFVIRPSINMEGGPQWSTLTQGSKLIYHKARVKIKNASLEKIKSAMDMLLHGQKNLARGMLYLLLEKEACVKS